MTSLMLVLACCRNQGSPPLAVSDVVGCYDLRVAAWKPPRSGGVDSLRLATFLPPPRVEFLSQPAQPSSPERLVVRPAPGSRASPHRFASWSLDGDSIRADWGTGFEGVEVTLGREGVRLRGHASPMTDADRFPRPVSKAVATPVRCDEAPVYPFEASQLVSRTVRLEGEDSLVLGEPLPDGIRTSIQEGPLHLVVQARAVGPFKGATGLYVTLSRGGMIREVRFEFPGANDSDSLAAVLTEALVKPEWRGTALGSTKYRWGDWTTWLGMGRSQERLWVTLEDPRLR